MKKLIIMMKLIDSGEWLGFRRMKRKVVGYRGKGVLNGYGNRGEKNLKKKERRKEKSLHNGHFSFF